MLLTDPLTMTEQTPMRSARKPRLGGKTSTHPGINEHKPNKDFSKLPEIIKKYLNGDTIKIDHLSDDAKV